MTHIDHATPPHPRIKGFSTTNKQTTFTTTATTTTTPTTTPSTTAKRVTDFTYGYEMVLEGTTCVAKDDDCKPERFAEGKALPNIAFQVMNKGIRTSVTTLSPPLPLSPSHPLRLLFFLG